MQFGFVILSHREPAQVRRLIETLNRLYDCPPIACHHDISQSLLDRSGFAANVAFVDPPIVVPWGKWAVVEAMLATLGLLYARADPAYFFLISGADYPTASRVRVLADVRGSSADAFIDHFELEEALRHIAPPGDPHLAHHRAPYNVKLERDHYLRVQARIPIIRFRPPPYSSSAGRYPRPGRLTVALPLDAWSTPFDPDYKCFVGSQWFTGSRKAAQALLNPSAKDLALKDYYRNRVIPDESYVQTVLCNRPDLAIDGRTFRYASWNGAHPVDLGLGQLEAIRSRGAHFSRKFSFGDPVLDAIDRDLDLPLYAGLPQPAK